MTKLLNVVAERNLVNLLLYETKVTHKKLVKEFDGVLITSYPHNYTDMKYEIMRHNINLKITLSEIRKMMLRKTKRTKNAVKSQLGSRKVSDFVELTLKRSKFTDINDNKKRKKNERMVLQKKKRSN